MKSGEELLIIIEAYAEAAADNYWQEDQGVGSSVDHSRDNLREARKALMDALELEDSKPPVAGLAECCSACGSTEKDHVAYVRKNGVCVV